MDKTKNEHPTMKLERMYEWCIAAIEAEMNGKPLELSTAARRELRSAGRKAMARLLKRREIVNAKQAAAQSLMARKPAVTLSNEGPAINDTDLVYLLNAEQIAHLSLGLERNFDLILRRDAAGDLWLVDQGPSGAAVIIGRPRTVEQVWHSATIMHAYAADS
jgi:hypothetical protein